MSWNTPSASCQGKQPWPTKAAALDHRKRLMARRRGRHTNHKEKGRGASALHPYPCRECGQWHLGNKNTGKPTK